jgi:hypothetical protein
MAVGIVAASETTFSTGYLRSAHCEYERKLGGRPDIKSTLEVRGVVTVPAVPCGGPTLFLRYAVSAGACCRTPSTTSQFPISSRW